MGRQHGISAACAVAALAIVCAPGCGGHGRGGSRTAPPSRASKPGFVGRSGPTPARAVAAAREACRRANIVIVCLDAARRDHVGCYGYARPTTPEIDRLAAQGVRFANAVSDASYTLAAVASLWSGQYPDTHGASVVGMRLPLALTTLPEVCRAAGMRTAVTTSSGIIIRAHGFGDGVDQFVPVFTARPDQGRVPDLQREWRKWLEAVGRQRFFLYVHIMPPHHPYEVAGQFRGRFDPGYAGSLAPTPEILPQLDAGKLRISQRDRRHIIAMYDESLRYGDWALGTLVRDLRARPPR
jgi:arylsulfatase A-like enzyme